MLAKLTQVIENLSTSEFTLRTIFVNPEHIITITEDDRINFLNSKKPLLEGLNSEHQFSRVSIQSGGTQSKLITVIGSPETVLRALNKSSRQLIKG